VVRWVAWMLFDVSARTHSDFCADLLGCCERMLLGEFVEIDTEGATPKGTRRTDSIHANSPKRN